MNDSRITDRTLERLRLGELSDTEVADVMARLEEAGETDRLDRLIDYDEAFLAQFPSAAAAREIRAAARRRTRSASAGPERVGLPRFAVAAAMSVAAIAIVATVVVSSRPGDGPAVEPAASKPPSLETNTTAAETTDDERAQPEESDADVGLTPWHGLLDWTVHNNSSDLAAVACTPGTELEVRADSVSRVSVENTRFAEVQASEDRETLVVKCLDKGMTTLNFRRSDETATNVLLRIAAPYVEEPMSSVSAGEQLDFDLAECGDLEDMALQIVVERGFPAMVIVGGGTKQQQACVQNAARALRDERPRQADYPSHVLIERRW